MSAGAVAAVEAVRFKYLERSEHHTLGSALFQLVCYDVLHVLGGRARKAHDADCAAFGAVQREVLIGRLAANLGTAYGKDHDFASMLASGERDLDGVVDAFRRGHPLAKYEHFAPYVERIAGGEAAVLNAEAETMLAATSGTSGRRALLPSTKLMSSTFFTHGILVVFDTLRRAGVDCFHLQRTCKLTFAAAYQEAPGSGLRIGPNSSGPGDPSFKRLLPLYSSPLAAYQIATDEASAMYVHALFAVRDRQLGVLEANFASLPNRLLDLVAREGFRLADDVEKGQLCAVVAARLDPVVVRDINAALGGGSKARADEIRAALRGPLASGQVAEDGVLVGGLARRVWPNLRLILANATGSFEVYARRLLGDHDHDRAQGGGAQGGGAQGFGAAAGVPILSTIYAASEGLMGVAIGDDSGTAESQTSHAPQTDGFSVFCLVPRAMFFEFLPIVDGDASPPGPKAAGAPNASGEALVGGTLLASELTVGEDYELVVTTLGGLCRYRLGDVVRVAGFHGGAPLVECR